MNIYSKKMKFIYDFVLMIYQHKIYILFTLKKCFFFHLILLITEKGIVKNFTYSSILKALIEKLTC